MEFFKTGLLFNRGGFALNHQANGSHACSFTLNNAHSTENHFHWFLLNFRCVRQKKLTNNTATATQYVMFLYFGQVVAFNSLSLRFVYFDLHRAPEPKKKKTANDSKYLQNSIHPTLTPQNFSEHIHKYNRTTFPVANL